MNICILCLSGWFYYKAPNTKKPLVGLRDKVEIHEATLNVIRIDHDNKLEMHICFGSRFRVRGPLELARWQLVILALPCFCYVKLLHKSLAKTHVYIYIYIFA